MYIYPYIYVYLRMHRESPERSQHEAIANPARPKRGATSKGLVTVAPWTANKGPYAQTMDATTPSTNNDMTFYNLSTPFHPVCLLLLARGGSWKPPLGSDSFL